MTLAGGWLLALVFGIVFNWVVSKQGDDDLTGLWVAVGVLVTLIISALPSQADGPLMFTWGDVSIRLTNPQHAAVYELRFFIASGTPMLIGYFSRRLGEKVGHTK